MPVAAARDDRRVPRRFEMFFDPLFGVVDDRLFDALPLAVVGIEVRGETGGFFGIIRNVIIPMGKPVIAVNATFVFLRTWNDFLTPLILLTRKETQTVMVALSALVSRYSADPPYQMAGLLIATVPAVVMYLFFQKYLVEGVNAGSLK